MKGGISMITLDGYHLTLNKVDQILNYGELVNGSSNSWEIVQNSRKAVEKIVEGEQTVYGITTGFGNLSDVRIAKDDTKNLQINLIRSHACGVGDPFSEKVSRGMLLLRANTLLKGYSGVRTEVIDLLLKLLNAHIHPVIPQQGSLGASGDLAPLAHLALVLTGEGEVFYQNERMPSMKALSKEGLSPITLTAKEGLALINGTQAMTSMGVVNYLESEKLAHQAESTAAITMEGLRGIIDVFDDELHVARGYPEQLHVAQRMSAYLRDSKLITKQGEIRVQDAYSLRCIPQVHGATWQTLGYVKEKLEIEINAATDNPLIFDDGRRVISGGNFHGQPIALAMDFLGIAMAEIANISERRVERLVNPQLNDLPSFLSPDPGLQSGAMILQYTAASLVSENKTLAHPASVDSIPSSGNQEDHVSMGTIASRHASDIIANTRKVIGIEMICAMQACDYRGTEKMALRTNTILREGRRVVPSIEKDRMFSNDIAEINEWLKNGKWQELLVEESKIENQLSGGNIHV